MIKNLLVGLLLTVVIGGGLWGIDKLLKTLIKKNVFKGSDKSTLVISIIVSSFIALLLLGVCHTESLIATIVQLGVAAFGVWTIRADIKELMEKQRCPSCHHFIERVDFPEDESEEKVQEYDTEEKKTETRRDYKTAHSYRDVDYEITTKYHVVTRYKDVVIHKECASCGHTWDYPEMRIINTDKTVIDTSERITHKSVLKADTQRETATLSDGSLFGEKKTVEKTFWGGYRDRQGNTYSKDWLTGKYKKDKSIFD